MRTGGHGLAARACPTTPAGELAQLESREGQRAPVAAPALGIGHWPSDRDWLKLGWDMGPQVGLAPMAGQGSGKLETGTAVEPLGQGQMALGHGGGVWV